MANALTPMSPTYWSKIMGMKLYKKNVFKNIASFKEESVLTNGQKVDRPYRSDIFVDKYVKGTAMTAQDITANSDQLTVDKIFSGLIYVDEVDKIQNKWDAAAAWSAEGVTRLSNQIDADCLYQSAIEANDTVDYNDLDSNQTAGAAVILTTANVLNLFTVTARKLDDNNVDSENRFFVMSARVKQILLTYLAGRESILGDKTGEAGNIGTYMGMSLYVSTNLTSYIRWTPSTAPTNNQTFILNGITFTFVDTIGTTAGNVLANSETIAQAITRLVTLINAPGTTTANGVAFTGSNLAALNRGWVAVDGTTYIDIWIKGGNQMTKSGTAAGTNTYLKQLNVAGEKGCTDLVVQKQPSVQMGSTISAGKWGMNVAFMDLYACGVFFDMQARVFSVEIDTSVF